MDTQIGCKRGLLSKNKNESYG